MQEHEDAGRNDYPLGRGYGHDYMRGGEVLGGYGYSEREEYEKARGDAADGSDGAHGAPAEPPQDLRAPLSLFPPADESDAPHVKSLRHIYGSTGQLHFSRSFYVTQAQVLGRIYGPQRYRRAALGPYYERVSTRTYDDAALKLAVQEGLFHDTWVDAERIVVEVEDGVVSLAGRLRGYDEIRYACDDAWDVPGVRGVRCLLTVEE